MLWHKQIFDNWSQSPLVYWTSRDGRWRVVQVDGQCRLCEGEPVAGQAAPFAYYSITDTVYTPEECMRMATEMAR